MTAQRVVVTDYYDGALQGLAEIQNACFRFDVIAWDVELNKRVYCFAPYPSGASPIEDMEQLLASKQQTPSWPYWCLSLQTRAGDRDKELMASVEDILNSALPFTSAWLAHDITDDGPEPRQLVDGWIVRSAVFRASRDLQPFEAWAPFFERESG